MTAHNAGLGPTVNDGVLGLQANDLDRRLGQAIQVARLSKTLDLAGLAARLDIAPHTLAELEAGEARISAAMVYAIGQALGVSLDALFGAAEAQDSRH